MDTQQQTPSKNSVELIVYQIGEIKNLLTEAKNEWKGFKDTIDKRVTDLEIWQAGEKEKDKGGQPLDIQKIVLSALGIASAAIALALGLIQGGVIK